MNSPRPTPKIEVRNLDLVFGSFVLMRDINAQIHEGSIFVVMGGSGCGKSTLFKHMIGLMKPQRGDVFYGGKSLVQSSDEERQAILRRCGILFQSGALWSSMTLAENVALPLKEYTDLTEDEIRGLVGVKLSLVGLQGFEDYYPSELSGGMRKRAALARAMALDPEILFFDEPSAGLDPITSRRLDELIVELRDSLGATVVLVTHELDTILNIGDDSIFLDAETRSVRARGNPRELLRNSTDARVVEFLTRGAPVSEDNQPLNPTGNIGEKSTDLKS